MPYANLSVRKCLPADRQQRLSSGFYIHCLLFLQYFKVIVYKWGEPRYSKTVGNPI
jgi:hypothetical protein